MSIMVFIPSKNFIVSVAIFHMKVAQKRNAVQEGMFYFRKDIFKGWLKKIIMLLKFDDCDCLS